LDPDVRRLVLRIGGAVVVLSVFGGGMWLCSGRSEEQVRRDHLRDGCVSAGHEPTLATHERCKQLAAERCASITAHAELRGCAKTVGDELFGRKP
jgi:hypothetical protein